MEDETELCFRSNKVTRLEMFVCTYGGKITSLACSHMELIKMLQIAEPVKALNCNFGHQCLPGYESLIKTPKKTKNMLRRPRKTEGDGTCFNSAIEASILFKDKMYKLKCFPSTGEIQVPGVIFPDFEDGKNIIQQWVDFLQHQPIEKKIQIIEFKTIMINFKFQINPVSPRVIIHLKKFAALLEHIPTPYPIREIKPPLEDSKVSAKFMVSPGKKVRINVFLKGKINILGCNTKESAEIIYTFLKDLISVHWQEILCVLPVPD
ncbi:pB263R [African swine fever virus]|uniref:Putative TATA-binding protein pB263R n=5 Tax=African swine fever virus TaxID=10497 RepID=TBP_ASFB7|nr:pB263R [African swine fever virus]YP_009702334.1 pB263R [African swine fever virus]YP_009702492.1 pB263R [African swine fever virus]YP_009702653.1 pB263R [African swine fever virus]YP_009703143.1 B263R [African swine fever virus]YP_009703340.1 pB263R [African swine fever virus]YP_009703539.1 pB263R [African swine fever virus Benin 97/1]YP_009703694.1 pB263R [African swine fever virus OURT 88/3]YP_009703856.1 hypothetical protein F8224_gp094 [African swine fever virus E75]Q65175.1 RecNam